MDWRGRRGSQNIEDRRSVRGAGVGKLSGVGVLALLVVGYFLGIDVTPLLQETAVPQNQPSEMTAQDIAAGEFVSVTLADTEEVWASVFRSYLGQPYTAPTLVLYKGVTQSACGGASGATGPFYCPGDKKIYLDTDFFVTMERRLGASGDFAMAYVVAHEIAHYVQDELGILGKANDIRAQLPEIESNAISVRIELQADCLAGVWARQAAQKFGSLDNGDVEEAVNAAHQIGDDTLQRNAGANPNPHSFTHGTSAQRADWFMKGLKSGDLGSCDTFSTDTL
jgi:predicted metalloprotease